MGSLILKKRPHKLLHVKIDLVISVYTASQIFEVGFTSSVASEEGKLAGCGQLSFKGEIGQRGNPVMVRRAEDRVSLEFMCSGSLYIAGEGAQYGVLDVSVRHDPQLSICGDGGYCPRVRTTFEAASYMRFRYGPIPRLSAACQRHFTPPESPSFQTVHPFGTGTSERRDSSQRPVVVS